MTLTQITINTNANLAGENLTLSQLTPHLDAVIDELNAALSTKYPVFSEFTANDYGTRYPNYNFFPDKFIRSVVCLGAAYKFYLADEEGAETAEAYGKEYSKNLFIMVRDHSGNVEEEFSDLERGFMIEPAQDYSKRPNNLDCTDFFSGGV